jgi:hypothetical protein
MSKLDNLILIQNNKVLDGKEEKLGDYIDPFKHELKDLMLGVIGEDETEWTLEQMDATDDLEEALEISTRNQLRRQQRQALKELFGEDV